MRVSSFDGDFLLSQGYLGLVRLFDLLFSNSDFFHQKQSFFNHEYLLKNRDYHGFTFVPGSGGHTIRDIFIDFYPLYLYILIPKEIINRFFVFNCFFRYSHLSGFYNLFVQMNLFFKDRNYLKRFLKILSRYPVRLILGCLNSLIFHGSNEISFYTSLSKNIVPAEENRLAG